MVLYIFHNGVHVRHDAVFQQLALLEHHQTVAAVLQHIGGTAHRILRIQVNRLAVNPDVFHPALAFHACKVALGVQNQPGRNLGIDSVGHAGNLHEGPMLTGIFGNAHFQGVCDLLTGGFNDCAHIAEGECLQQIIIGKHALLNGIADGAAVYHTNVRIQHAPVSIRYKVSQVGFPIAHQAFPGLRVIGSELYKGFTYRLVQYFFKPFILFGHQFGNLGIRCFQAFHQFGGDGAIFFDNHLPQALKLGSGLGYQHCLPRLVNDLMRGNVLFVGVSVNDSVNIVSVGRHRTAGPVGDGALSAQVPYQENVVRSFFADVVDGTLYRLVDFFAGLVFAETVDEFPILILEIYRS